MPDLGDSTSGCITQVLSMTVHRMLHHCAGEGPIAASINKTTVLFLNLLKLLFKWMKMFSTFLNDPVLVIK